MQPVAGKHMAAQRCDQRRQQRAGLADPVGHGGAGEVDALAGVDLRLPVEWQGIAIFGGQDMSDQAGRGLPRSIGADGIAAEISVSQPLQTSRG